MNTEVTTEGNLYRLLSALGYQGREGLKRAADFEKLSRYRSSLLDAAHRMGVRFSFGLCGSDIRGKETYTPLVFISVAISDDEVDAIHRQAWSQGIVPFILVVTAEKVWLCDGFRYSRTEPASTRRAYPADDCGAAENEAHLLTLSRLRADNLGSSIGWRDYAVDREGRVDLFLLKNLDRLCGELRRKSASRPALDAKIATALIGRLLFVYMLIDRGTLPVKWFDENKHDIHLLTGKNRADLNSFWALVDDLDGTFNGSTFRLGQECRSQITADHIEFVRRVMRHGSTITEGGEQLSFVDIEFSVLRIETLSAVYELFLQHQDPDNKKNTGAYYTPPFIADFVIEYAANHISFDESVKVLDPSSGSGVFLVGALRQIVEGVLLKEGISSGQLPFSRLCKIVKNSIFGVELSDAACNVAAFSIYMTMLDYADPSSVKLPKPARKGLFPTLVGKTILCMDFFDKHKPASFPKKFDIVLGNPPWGSVADGTNLMQAQFSEQDARLFVGNQQAAEFFCVTAIRQNVKKGGVLGMLIPYASLTNNDASRFRSWLSSNKKILGLANFSHFRRTLFKGAEKSAAALFVKNENDGHNHNLWVYSPLAAGQPARPGTPLWSLFVDSSECALIPQSELNKPEGWHQALSLTPIDRRIVDYLRLKVSSGRLLTLRKLEGYKIGFKRGKSPLETGVPASYQLTTKKGEQFYLNHVGLPQGRLNLSDSLVPLPAEILNGVRPNFKKPFSGNIVLVPRSGKLCVFSQHPVAYNDTFIGIYPVEDGGDLFMRALTRYLNSSLARYLLTLAAPTAMADIPRIDFSDLRDLPLPFKSLEDDFISYLAAAEGSDVDSLISERVGLTSEYENAIAEFLSLRIGFRNANTPKDALCEPDEEALADYQSIFQQRINPFRAKTEPRFVASVRAMPDKKLGLVLIHRPAQRVEKVLSSALQAFEQSSYDLMSNSSFVWTSPTEGAAVVIKPLQAYHWTMARAYEDGLRAHSRIASIGRNS